MVPRSVAQFGRALRSGRRGRVFESRRFDTYKDAVNLKISGIFSIIYIFL